METALAPALLRMIDARFTLDGSPALEARLGSLCDAAVDRVRAVIPDHHLDLILLGGGYGRGEGGVLQANLGEAPYNDLEFYVLARGNYYLQQRRYHQLLEQAAHSLSEAAGIEHEFKLLTVGKLRASEPTMFYYDLIAGHRCLFGDEALLGCCNHHLSAHRIPLHEATRLLMNRCSGLLFAQARLQRPEFSAEDADFVGRNIAKAKLALGDVVLCARGQYHWSCRERHKRLRKLEDTSAPLLERIVSLHQEGVAFKLHPRHSSGSAAEFQAEHGHLKSSARELWFWLENKRLGRSFAAIEEYSSPALSKCPETNTLKNRLINARSFGAGGLSDSRYPRERLLNALPLLLWDPDCLKRPATLRLLQSELNTTATDLQGLTAAYERLWRNFN